MKRYITAAEIAALARRPLGTIYWWAARDNWRRNTDGRKPTLYNLEDVGRTLARLDT